MVPFVRLDQVGEHLLESIVNGDVQLFKIRVSVDELVQMFYRMLEFDFFFS